MLTVLSLYGIKLACAGPMSLGISLFTHNTIAFVIILNRTLHKLMGRNCIIFYGLTTFGIRTSIASFIPVVRTTDSKNSKPASSYRSLFLSEYEMKSFFVLVIGTF